MQEVRFYERAQAQAHSMIRNLPEEMVLDRRPVPHQPASSNRGVRSAHRRDHLRMAGFAALHESGLWHEREVPPRAARADSD
jgi:hypothetical protein